MCGHTHMSTHCSFSVISLVLFVHFVHILFYLFFPICLLARGWKGGKADLGVDERQENTVRIYYMQISLFSVKNKI